jgi:predicted dehydrogenase
MYQAFFEAVRTRKPPPLNPEFALEATKLAYAAWMSIDERRIVTDKDFS